jgi:hypothetical protein
MTTYMGIWIDRRKAYAVTLQRTPPAEYDYKQRIEIIHSDVEPRVRLSGGARTRNTPWGPQDVRVDGKSQARRQQQLKQYFEQIIGKIRAADRILIMGPGDTKLQLRKEMEKDGELAARIGLVETVDKLTPKQIAARVRGFFDIHYHTESSGV